MAMQLDTYFGSFFLCIFCFACFLNFPAEGCEEVSIRVKNVSRLCHAKPIVTKEQCFHSLNLMGKKLDNPGLGLPPSTSDAHTINGNRGHSFRVHRNIRFQWRLRQAKLTCQTTNVLIKADQPPSRYFMAARPFMDLHQFLLNKTVTGILHYKGTPTTVLPSMPKLPAPNNTNSTAVLFYTVGLGANACPSCQNGTQLTASLNNITFVMPKVGLLQAHYFNIKGVFKTDFPDRPPVPFNYTGAPLLQQTWALIRNTPHGVGNFDPSKDPAKFNLVDPPERNTVGVPTGGWTVLDSELIIQLIELTGSSHTISAGVLVYALSPGAAYNVGLKMAFVVENGKSPEESILPPQRTFHLARTSQKSITISFVEASHDQNALFKIVFPIYEIPSFTNEALHILADNGPFVFSIRLL
ncbi:hypothetical protein GQ457_08G020160 [Hibiscus cannabinus]